MSILEKFWYGNVKPTEKKLSSNSKQNERVKLITRHEEAILPIISGQARKAYESYGGGLGCHRWSNVMRLFQAFASAGYYTHRIREEDNEEYNRVRGRA